MVESKYLLIYFHSSGEDIKLSHKLLDLLRNLYQVQNPNLDKCFSDVIRRVQYLQRENFFKNYTRRCMSCLSIRNIKVRVSIKACYPDGKIYWYWNCVRAYAKNKTWSPGFSSFLLALKRPGTLMPLLQCIDLLRDFPLVL